MQTQIMWWHYSSTDLTSKASVLEQSTYSKNSGYILTCSTAIQVIHNVLRLYTLMEHHAGLVLKWVSICEYLISNSWKLNLAIKLSVGTMSIGNGCDCL